ncbi:MAG: Lytic transglycosylase catalytic, partial [Solirubrobacterales bacterium]|nr:Lytic transglycosylase catalytic [Solirubrobacterales bacterium]
PRGHRRLPLGPPAGREGGGGEQDGQERAGHRVSLPAWTRTERRAARTRGRPCHLVGVVSSSSARRRALALLALAVGLGVLVALALRSDDPTAAPGDAQVLRPGAAPGEGFDPLRYVGARREEYERRAARGLSHPLFAKSPGGAVATAPRVAAWRPLVDTAAAKGDVDPDTLEALVFLESAGRPDAMAGGTEGAVGLTQILAETGQNLLGMRIDVERSAALTRGIARGRRVAARTRERRRVDERYDPAKALAASVRYLRFARGELGGSDELAVVGYHMGVGNLQDVLKRFDADEDTRYAEVFFSASPLRKASAHRKLASLGDDSSTYLWRIGAAREIMRRFREEPAALATEAALQTSKNSAEEVLHPPATAERFADPFALGRARAKGTLEGLGGTTLAGWGIRIDPKMGELAPRLEQSKRLYRALRPEALRVLEYLGRGVQEIADAKQPLTLTSTARDDEYQRLLTRRNIEATRDYSLHTTGYAFDIARRYASRAQAEAFQFLLDRLTALDLIAWVREPGAIHVTVARDAGRLLQAAG